MKRLSVLFLFILVFSSVISQSNRPIRFQHITAENGLSQGHILCMLQDREGYIWIGTYYGLNRFNGYSIHFYTENLKDTNALISKVVYSLFEDRNGYLWVGTVWGLDRFDKKTERFEHIPVDTTNRRGLSDGYIHAITQDRNGDIWVATDKGGLNKIDYKTHRVTYFQRGFGKPDQLLSNNINDITIDSKNGLWIATESGGLSCMNLDNYSVCTYSRLHNPRSSRMFDKISCSFVDRSGTIWFGNFDGVLTSFNDKTEKFTIHRFLPTEYRNKVVRIRDIAEDDEGNLLIATMGAGLVIYNLETGKSLVNVHHLKDPGTIISNEAYSLLVDRSGTVFVGTYGMGISRYSPSNRKFPVYYVSSDGSEGDKNSYTDCIEDSFGRLVIGTYHGFCVYDRKTNVYKHYLPGRTYEDNKILTIALAPDGSIWLGSNHSLHRYDKNFNKIKSYVFLKDNSDHPIYSIFFDQYHNLWFGLFIAEGLFKISESEWKNTTKNDLKYKQYRTNYSDSTTINGDEVWCIKEDKKHNLWIAENLGITKYDPYKDNFIRINLTHMPKTIEFDNNDNLWVTSRGDGVFFYNVHTGKSRHYTANQGLCENFVFGAIADNNGDIWFNTENGLSRFNPKTVYFRNYDIYDGLPNNRFDDRSEKMLSNGDIYMGTAQGFVIFNPNEIKDDDSKPQIVITDFKVSNISVINQPQEFKKNILNGPIGRADTIELQPSQRDFSFEFAALDYAAPHKIKYAYKLEGFDKDWIKTDAKNRIARYTNLDGGTYTFLVKATNSDGVWNNTPRAIKVIVIPPFYKTIWFKSLVVCSLVVIVILAFTWRILWEIKQRQILSKLVEERTQEISSKNELLKETAESLGETNAIMEERQQLIEEQKEELAAHRDELAKLNAQKDKLFSIIAHDLKNPFNIIIGYADLLLLNNRVYDAEKRHRFLTFLQQSAHNAYLLLENLLQWSRSQSGTLVFDPLPLNIDKLIVNSIKQVTDIAENKGVNIVFEHEHKDVIVQADENMINTVVRNLITNAIKFSHKGGNITVYLSKADNQFAKISIADEGVGMTQETCNNLFRIDKNFSTIGTAGEKGTGLGLVLCKDFIDTHKGKIWVESEPDKGTTFIFTIPLGD
ncbi:MAG TPA: two-component regulator propeller domain-containing protein [Bacteroidales bacterium]